jgi:molybdate transport system permease protein
MNTRGGVKELEELKLFWSGLDWSPLIISLKTGIVATILSFFMGIYAARKVLQAGPKGKAIADGFLTLTLVLPPTVVGFVLLLIFSLRRPIGSFLYGTFDIKVVQSWLGCIVAATVIAFPLMYRNARAAFEQVDVNLIYAARTLGLSETKVFWRVVMPSAGPGITSGTILTFARALGEYGATSMLAGNIPGKTGTISQRIAMVIQDGDYVTAGFWVVIISLIAFLIIVAMNLAAAKSIQNRKRW